MKIIFILVAVLVAVGGGVYWYSNNAGDVENERVGMPTAEEEESGGKLKVVLFSGPLEEVNVGCYADGECFVVVGGKHVTVLMGWSQKTVGSVLSTGDAELSIGDLEGRIGEIVQVYAQDKSDSTYTLYGSEGFYVKIK